VSAREDDDRDQDQIEHLAVEDTDREQQRVTTAQMVSMMKRGENGSSSVSIKSLKA